MIELPVMPAETDLPEKPADLALALAEGDGVRCLACSHRCLVLPGRAGACRVRHNRGGRLFAPWGYVSAATCEPMEKKPFFHALPGRKALTFGMLGCNYHCDYCVNWKVSQARRDPRAGSPPLPCSPDDLARLARQHGAAAVVASYNEPLIAAEWIAAVFRRARDFGLLCGVVSNGSATPEVLRLLRPCVDLFKIDLKAFRDASYRQFGGVLSDVLASIERARAMGFWLEVVTVVALGFNDGDAELRGMARFLASVSPDIPWHLAPFRPDYRMTAAEGHGKATPPAVLLRAFEIGVEAGLRFVYVSGMPRAAGEREHTRCPRCRAAVVERAGYLVRRVNMRGGNCRQCGQEIPGVWEHA